MFGPIAEEYKEMAADINSSGNHLLTLLNDILDLSKSNTQAWVMSSPEGQASLITLGTWSQLGLLSKMAEIKSITKGK